MKIRDRIKEFKRIPANELQPDPRNWRTHPTSQRDALKGILAEVGFADACIVRQTPEGGYVLVDGHLRTETCHDQQIPCLVLDITEEEAGKVLLTLDPLAALAGTDNDKLESLLHEVETESEALSEMLAKLGEDAGIIPPDFEPASEDEQGRLDEKAPIECPHCHKEFVPE